MDVNRLLNPPSADPPFSKSSHAEAALPGNRIIPAAHTPSPSSWQVFRWDCNQIRNKINALMRSGDYKVTHFQRELGINSNSYCRFMKLMGPAGGIDNQTYEAAHDFFLERERKGIKAPKAKKPRAEDLKKLSVDSIHLDGEEADDVPVYDTCDDLRPKIQAHLRQTGVTQAAFLREVGRQYHEPRSIQSAQLQRFLKMKGPTAGATNAVYYASYSYLEKLRIKKGAPKSKKRLEVEERRPGGMSLKPPRAIWCHQGDRPCEDDFGFVHVQRM